MTNKNETVKLSLIDNALDYILTAAESAGSSMPRQWKYALLHLVAGIELLLKARLEAEHWTLLFADIDKASRQKLANGDFQSTDFNTAISRLQNIANVTIEPPAYLDDLRRSRNRVQHFDFSIDQVALRAQLARGCNFVVDFVQNHLREKLNSEQQQAVDKIVQRFAQFRDFVEERMRLIKEPLKKAKVIEDCPRCEMETLVLGGEQPKCLFCNFSAAPDVVAAQMGCEAVTTCPRCRGPFVVNYIEHDIRGTCFACGLKGEYNACIRCGLLSESLDYDYICVTCRTKIVSVLT
jgi:hypothetical protein